jgi:hypothetical protein
MLRADRLPFGPGSNPRLASRCEVSSHVEVRAYTYSRRRILPIDVGEQKQHEKGSTARGHVHTPRREIVLLIRVAIVTGKADIDMPAGIARIVRMRETYCKTPRPERRRQRPTSWSNAE